MRHMAKKAKPLVLVAGLLLSACAADESIPELMNVRNADGTPDEFGILPSKPLEQPPSYASLPEPTPGASNLTDPTPEADAVAALGGRRDRVEENGEVARSDQGLIGYAGRYGVDGEIRTALAAEDLEYRRQNEGLLLERIFNLNIYFRAYSEQSLDQHSELERWRRAGVEVPTAPPKQTRDR
jgi:hypothetical protein